MVFPDPISCPQNDLSLFDLKIDRAYLFPRLHLSVFGLVLIKCEIWLQDVFSYFRHSGCSLVSQGGIEEFSLRPEFCLCILKIEKVKREKIPFIQARLDIANDDPFICIWVEKVFVGNHPFFEYGGEQSQCGLTDGRIEAFSFEERPFF